MPATYFYSTLEIMFAFSETAVPVPFLQVDLGLQWTLLGACQGLVNQHCLAYCLLLFWGQGHLLWCLGMCGSFSTAPCDDGTWLPPCRPFGASQLVWWDGRRCGGEGMEPQRKAWFGAKLPKLWKTSKVRIGFTFAIVNMKRSRYIQMILHKWFCEATWTLCWWVKKTREIQQERSELSSYHTL